MTYTDELTAVKQQPAKRRSWRRTTQRLADSRLLVVVAPLLVVALLVCAWQIATQFTDPVLISSPSAVARAFGSIFGGHYTLDAIGVSLRELYEGLSIGLACGLALGILIGRFRLVHYMTSPIVNTVNAIPVNVFVPFLIIWIGLEASARILFIALITLFPVLLSTAAGIRNVGVGYVELGKSLCLGEWQMLRQVVIPAATPYMFAGARIGISLSIIGVVIGEMEISNVGIGYLLLQYASSYRTAYLMALLFTASLVGVVNVVLLRSVEKRWFKWATMVR